MRKAPSFIAFIFLLAGLTPLKADTLAEWTFEVSQPSGVRGPGIWFTNVTAEVGSGTASSWHSGFEAYSSFPGNGSLAAFGATNSWAVGDFYQFAVSTTGYQNLAISFDQAGNLQGPGTFYLAYSTDGSTFTKIGTDYAVGVGHWNFATTSTTNAFSFNLNAIAGVNNQTEVYFRIVDDSRTAINGGLVVAGGDDRIDNFLVSAQVVPEPATLALMGLGVTCGVFLTAGRRERWLP
jgi:hypothetical protein